MQRGKWKKDEWLLGERYQEVTPWLQGRAAASL